MLDNVKRAGADGAGGAEDGDAFGQSGVSLYRVGEADKRRAATRVQLTCSE